MSASLDVQPVDERRLRLPAPGGILASAPARQCAPAMSGGWDANGEYVPLGAVDASVEVGHLDDTRDSEEEARGESGRGDKRATSPRWGKVRREVRASVAVAKVAAAFAGTESFETLAAQAAARRLMAAGAPAATSGLRQRHVVDLEGAVGLGGAVFISAAGDQPECLALTIGASSTQLHLLNARTLAKQSVALEMPTFICKVALAPDASRACVAVGLDASARIAVFTVGVDTPWEQVWTQTKGAPVFDVEFSADGSVIACVTLDVHQVDIHDARTGILRARVPFGVYNTIGPQAKLCCTLRFSRELLVVSGGFGTADEKTVRQCYCSLSVTLD